MLMQEPWTHFYLCEYTNIKKTEIKLVENVMKAIVRDRVHIYKGDQGVVV